MEATKKNTFYWINSAIVLFCFFGFGLLPSFAGLSYAGMRAVGIFIGLLWGWIAVEFGWVSIIGIIAMGTTGAMSMTQAFAESFGSTTFMQLVFPMILLAYLGKSGFSEWMGYKIVAMKIAKGKPWLITAMIFVAATVLCYFVTTFPMIFLMWSLFLGLAQAVGYQKGDRYVSYVMSGIVFMQTIAACSVPWGFYAVTLQALMKDTLGSYALPFMPILGLGIIASILCILSWLAIGRFILKVDVNRMKDLPEDFYQKAATITLTKEGKIGMALMIAMIVLLGLPNFMPKTWWITNFLSSLGLHGVTLLLLAILLLFRYKNGERLTNTNELSYLGLNWDITFLVVSTLSMSALFKVEEVGIISTVTGALLPIVAHMPKSVFIIACLAIFWVATQATHNFVIVLTLVGAMAGVCSGMGIHPWLFAWMFMAGMMFAYSTPAASSPGALIYAHEWVGRKDAYLCGISFSLIGFIIFMVVMLPLATWVFGPWPAV